MTMQPEVYALVATDSLITKVNVQSVMMKIANRLTVNITHKDLMDNIFTHDWKPISHYDSVCNMCNQHLMKVILDNPCPEASDRAGLNEGENNGT
jgi:hypothetical protein